MGTAGTHFPLAGIVADHNAGLALRPGAIVGAAATAGAAAGGDHGGEGGDDDGLEVHVCCLGVACRIVIYQRVGVYVIYM